MKKIELIKTNDLFCWKIGEIYEYLGEIDMEGDYKNGEDFTSVQQEYDTVKGKVDGMVIPWSPEELIEKGYAKWVEDNLVDRVDELVERFEGGDVEIKTTIDPDLLCHADKYISIVMYDYIVKELNEGWEKKGSEFMWGLDFFEDEFDIYNVNQNCLVLRGAKTKEICKEMIDSKKFRPYLNKIFSIKDEQ